MILRKLEGAKKNLVREGHGFRSQCNARRNEGPSHNQLGPYPPSPPIPSFAYDVEKSQESILAQCDKCE